MNPVRRLFAVLGLICLAGTAFSQNVFLVHKKRKVPFPNSRFQFYAIGLKTATDTILYNKDYKKGFSIVEAGRDSVKLQRMVIDHDSSVRTVRYEYKSFAYKDILVLEYPIYNGSGDGCAGCILLPGINVVYLIYATRRWKPRRLDMRKWKFLVE